MYVPGFSCIVIGLFLMNRLRDTPQSLGLPPIEKYRNDYPADVQTDEKELSMKEILFTYVLRNKYVWLLACSYFFVYLVRQAMNDWGMLYLCEAKHYSQIFAGSCIVSFEMGGFFGSIVAGWASDYVFNGKRCPIIILFSLAVSAAIFGMLLSPYVFGWLDVTMMFIVGFLIYGPQMLIGMAAAEISHKKAAGSATGFIGWVAYLGAAVAGYPLSLITQAWGWEAFLIALGISGVIAACLLFPLWSIKVNPKYAKPQGDGNAAPTQA
jgi:OPA family sugar phosphate sensor protein UhpC-like MFS transporter